MADGCERGLGAPGFKHRSREKPTIYTTIDGQVIVEDEFLNFLAVKIKTMTQDEIVLIASSTFDTEWIESSKNTLFELCPNTKLRCVQHKGTQKDANNIKSCLKLLNECGDKTPRFVSHYLDELPPVTFNSLDVSSLLAKMERLHSEVSTLRQAVSLQADTGENLRAMTVSIGHRVNAVERRLGASSNGGHDSSSGEKERRMGCTPGSPAKSASVRAPESPCTGVPSGDGGACGKEGTRSGSTDLACPTPEGNRPVVNSPNWSGVVKRGRPRKNHPGGQIAVGGGKPARKTPKPIVGTGARGNISVIRTKLVSVFATKFSPDLNAETLAKYLSGQMGRSVNCQRIATAGNRYGSFKVTAECNEINEMYNPEIWPEGSLVRRYYEPRKAAGVATSARPLSDSGSLSGADAPLATVSA